MKRLNDNFIDNIDSKLSLKAKTILEIGCGNGNKSVALANRCKKLLAIDPDVKAIDFAKNNFITKNLSYSVGLAQKLKFDNDYFDVVIFSLSLHHVPVNEMNNAINEAFRVCKKSGYVVFLEPAFNGSYFDAEKIFDASDGDERKEKAAAYFEILNSSFINNEIEFYDEIIFEFESEQDFIDNMEPKKNMKNLNKFLKNNNFKLRAQRRINILKI